MDGEKPVVYIFHGDDGFSMDKAVAGMVAHLGDPGMADLNTTRLEGRTLTDDALRSAALAIPFLAERRMVIVNDALASFGHGQKEDSAKREKFLSLLNSLPATTALVLVVPDSQVWRRGSTDWDLLSEGHWLIKWARAAGPRAHVKEFSLPNLGAMPRWIMDHAQAARGQFTQGAARVLVEHVGNDTVLAAQEILKLITYANGRPVEEDDVLLLTIHVDQTNVFDMVDALGDRNSQQALKLLHALLEQNEPLELFGMITRQFRLLLQAREILDEHGSAATIEGELKVKAFVAKKLAAQASRFSMAQLEGIYRRLLEMDLAFKTSQMPGELAFDLLVAEL
ncbi:MAG TPA: DNA polymerase III subunit delta [Anaerolineaceae bacterium]|nr:DNA polymerase III subunit delta [Anaerolineaceae bacterium]HPN51217.1 DNA polymerase III subunit delta [Anaerolineaceae bacterium]